jgi:hypothetical protein
MRSVRLAKAEAIGRLRFSGEQEPGAAGAALLAEYSLVPDAPSLGDFLHRVPSDDKELSTR